MNNQKPPVLVKSLKKALDALTLLAFDDFERQGMALGELSRRLELPANTLHNLLKTMVACGYAAQTPSGTYCVGPRMLDAGRMNRLLFAVSAPELQHKMEKLCDALDEALTLVALVDGKRVSLCTATPHQAVGVNASAVEFRSIYAMPTGRVLAAYADASELARIVERNGLPGAAWDGISTRAGLERALALVRKKGHATISPDGPELVSFAVPVLDAEGGLVATLGCYAPRFRCDAKRQADLLKRLSDATPILSNLLQKEENQNKGE